MSKDEGPTQAEMDLQSAKWGIEEAETASAAKRLMKEVRDIQKKIRDENFDTLWYIVNSQHERWDEGESVDWRSVRIACEVMVHILTRVHFED